MTSGNAQFRVVLDLTNGALESRCGWLTVNPEATA
jgi:hypothetical protein